MTRLLVAALAFAAGLSHAQPWPAKPVTVIVPFPPGGPSDIAARPIAEGLSKYLGRPFVIENREGAGGNTGTALVAMAPPDGYTLLISSSAPIVINPSLYKNMPYDPQRDLVPITGLLRVPLVLAVHPSVPARNLQELLAHIKAQRGTFRYASAGNGTPQHLTAELLGTVATLEMAHVPYAGSAPAIADLLAGRVPMMFDSTVAIVAHLKSGKLRPIAVTGARRAVELPAVPTFAEAGVKGVESYAWYGLFARAGTPPDIVRALNAETIRVMRGPEFQSVLRATGSEYTGDTPDNFARFIRDEADKWAVIVKASRATVD
jgi:tripartite-type tricarboxylate transporter receptor subunit TctC